MAPSKLSSTFFGPSFSLAVELRFCLIELVLTGFFVFLSASATPSVLWECLPSCGKAPTASSPSAGMDMSGGMGAGGGSGMGGGMSMSSPSPSAPPSGGGMGGMSGTGGMDDGTGGMGGMGGMGNVRKLMDMGAMMMCPPPTAPIEVGLITGFAAAVVTSLSHNAMGAGNDASGWITDSSSATHSGAAFNPAITIALALTGYIPPARMIGFLTFQLTGAVIGGALVHAIVGDSCYDDALAGSAGHPKAGVGDEQLVVLHAVLSTLIVLTHLWASRRLHFMATPVIIGFGYIAASMMAYPLSGENNFNPLRGFGIAASVSSAESAMLWRQQWPAWIGALIGAVFGALLDFTMFNHAIWHEIEKKTAKKGAHDHAAGSYPPAGASSHKDMEGMEGMDMSSM